MNQYTTVLEHFIKHNYHLVQDMKLTEHGLIERNVSGYNVHINPYHMEGSVWTHTMLAYNHFKNFNNLVYVDSNVELAILIAILCHDIGKVHTREIVKGDKVAFYSHAFASIQPTIDFIYYLRDHIEFDVHDILNLVLPAVSNHIHFYNTETKNKNLLLNNSDRLKHVSMALAIADTNGSINSTESTTHKKTVPVDIELQNVKYNPDLRHVYLICGLPGVGKDYIAKQVYPDLHVLSFDNERIRAYREHNESNVNSDTEYHLAWEYCKNNKINLLSMLAETDKKLGKNSIVICNTNLTYKSRRKLMNVFGKANYFCDYVVSSLTNIKKRDINRKYHDKTVGDQIIKNMAEIQQIPTFREGFVSVNVINN
jgi:predicted kinase